MPLYEYHCQNCGQDVEVLVLGKEQPECPECHSQKLQKQLSVVATPNAKGASGSPSEFPGGASGMCGRPQCGMYGCQGLD